MEIYLITDFNFIISNIKLPNFNDGDEYSGKKIKVKFFFIRSLSYHDYLVNQLATVIHTKINNWYNSFLYNRLNHYIIYLYIHDYNCITLYNELVLLFDRSAHFRIIFNLAAFDTYIRELWRYRRYEIGDINILDFIQNRLDYYEKLITDVSTFISKTNFAGQEIIPYLYIAPPRLRTTAKKGNFKEQFLSAPLSLTITYNKRALLPEASSNDRELYKNDTVLYCSNLTPAENIKLFEQFIASSLNKINSKIIEEINDDILKENATWDTARKNARAKITGNGAITKNPKLDINDVIMEVN